MLDYYTITDTHEADGATVFDIEINPRCRVFDGHFPGVPVCPGVFNIQLIRECAEKVLGRKAVLQGISQCRLTKLMTPGQDPHVRVRISLNESSGTVKLNGEIYKEDVSFMKLKGELTDAIA